MAGNLTTTTSVDLNESQTPTLATVIILGAVLGTIAVATRFYTRIAIVGKVFRNDYCILAALVSTLIFSVCNGISLLHGFGRHGAAITPEDRTVILKVTIGVILFYHTSHMLIKSSILLQYIRICVLPIEKHICYAVMVLVIVEGFIWIMVLFLTCIPLSAMWQRDVPGAKCIDSTASFYACAATIISADVAILAIPTFLLRHLSISWRQKLILGAIFALGGVATIASILRVRVIYMATKGSDPAWDKAPNALLGAVEVDLGLICSCAITLLPLFRRWFPTAWPKGLRRSEADLHRGMPLSSPSSTKPHRQALVPFPGAMSSDSNYTEFKCADSNTDVESKASSAARL